MKTAHGPVRRVTSSAVPFVRGGREEANIFLSHAHAEIFSISPWAFAKTTGSRNIDPADARITFELKGLTVPSPSTTPALPNASAETQNRSNVPWVLHSSQHYDRS